MKKVLFQVSFTDAIMSGLQNGTADAADLVREGKYGLGTPVMPGGELIIVDGEVYVCNPCGKTTKVRGDTSVNFAVVADESESFSFELENTEGYENVRKKIERMITESAGNLNHFCLAIMRGRFARVNIRTNEFHISDGKYVFPQEYSDHEELHATAVGFYCPEYTAGLNMPGWHFHIISDDRRTGGHVMDMSPGKVAVSITVLTEWKLRLPNNEEFNSIDFRRRKDG